MKLTAKTLKRLRRSLADKRATSADVFGDIPRFYREVAYLKTDGVPSKKVKAGIEPKGWLDCSHPDTASLRCARFWQAPLSKGKWGRMWLGPRGSGKTVSLRVALLGSILQNRDIITQYSTQNIKRSAKELAWVRGRLQRAEKRFGELQTKEDWSNEQLTVVRPSGIGGDSTIEAIGPDKDVTGAHPDDFFLSDVVARGTNGTRNARHKVIDWFEDMLDQRSAGSHVNVIGTMWPGFNLYRKILRDYRDEFEIVVVPAYGPAHDGNGKVLWGEKDALNYPWLTEEFLAFQKRKNPRKFRAQYMNLFVDDEDAPFEATFLQYGEPPMAGNKLHPRLAVYLLTDTAQTDRATRGTSRTALIVIAKDTDGMIYVVDIAMGKWNAGAVEERFLEMYYKWSQQGLLYATMEMRGPGRNYISSIPKLAEARKTPVPAIRPLPRSPMEDKVSRIGMLYAPFKNLKIAFSEKLLDPNMFRIDSRGLPCGVVADEILDYSPYGDGFNDFLDALSDGIAFIDRAPVCPEPIPITAKKKEETPYEWSKRRAEGKLRRRRVI